MTNFQYRAIIFSLCIVIAGIVAWYYYASTKSTSNTITTTATASWTTPITLGDGSGSIGRGLAVDAQNRIHVVWRAQEGQSFFIGYMRSADGGKTWTKLQNLSAGRASGLSPNIAIGSDDSVHVAWSEKQSDSSVIIYTQSGDGGETWSAPHNVGPATPLLLSAPTITVDTADIIHLAWHEGENKILYTQSIDHGLSFKQPQQLNSSSAPAAWPRFTITGNGQMVTVAWRDNRRQPDWDIYVAVSTDAGQTFHEYPAQASSQREWDPDVVVDDHNVIHLAYGLYTDAGPTIVYAQSADQGKTWSSPITLSEYTSEFPFWAVYPGEDRVWLFWKDERDAPMPDNITRRSQGQGGRVDKAADVAAKFSNDGGITWSQLQRVTDLGSTEVKFPSPGLGPNGIPVIAWSDTHTGVEQVYFSLGQ
ncbi:MAG: exo-alpha-sialidase [Candidatus Kerfeldbacteria bacterium]|nr:exo-alpha-sialidase [Candidatus Kerfeldbacteria bacterium]